MKRLWVLFMTMILIVTLVACEEEYTKDVSNAVDYHDAVSFESTLNDGTKVNGNPLPGRPSWMPWKRP